MAFSLFSLHPVTYLLVGHTHMAFQWRKSVHSLTLALVQYGVLIFGVSGLKTHHNGAVGALGHSFLQDYFHLSYASSLVESPFWAPTFLSFLGYFFRNKNHLSLSHVFWEIIKWSYKHTKCQYSDSATLPHDSSGPVESLEKNHVRPLDLGCVCERERT